jgi:hypothetical protein
LKRIKELTESLRLGTYPGKFQNLQVSFMLNSFII